MLACAETVVATDNFALAIDMEGLLEAGQLVRVGDAAMMGKEVGSSSAQA